ncbi:MAG: glucose-1-phosphate adenylyltransferase [Verrucomicrobia bacterium]|nr:glucose-1-phosphate adenylyltransferase [Verrucomicrobiota bacterium]
MRPHTRLFSNKNVLSVIMGGGQGQRLYPLTKERAKPAVPIAGNYRLVDVPVSNCINSGLKRIYVLTQFNSVSLHRHIQQSYTFDAFSEGFVDILAAQQTPEHAGWYQGTADAVRQNFRHLLSAGGDLILILSGDQLYRMDFRPMLEQHIQHGADITIATLPVPRKSASSLGIMQVNADKRIVRFVEKPKEEKVLEELKMSGPLMTEMHLGNDSDHFLASMGIYVFNRDVLIKELDNDKTDFGKHIIPDAIGKRAVFAYLFKGFWEDIGTVRNFFDVHLALAKPKPPFDFYDAHAPVYTHPRFLPGSIVSDSQIYETIVAPGSVIHPSALRHCVIGVRSKIGKGSRLHDVVMMGADYYQDDKELHADDREHLPHIGIGHDCVIERAILDKNVRIGDGVHISPAGKDANMDHPLYCIRDGIVCIPKNSIIPSGTKI